MESSYGKKCADENIKIFMEEVGINKPYQYINQIKNRCHYEIKCNNEKILISIPIIPLDYIRYTDITNKNIWKYPRILINNYGYIWHLAIDNIKEKLEKEKLEKEKLEKEKLEKEKLDFHNDVMNLSNNQYGKWVVLNKSKRDKYGVMRWLCKCQCGVIKYVSGLSLRNGNSLSCGCQISNFQRNGRIWERLTTRIIQCIYPNRWKKHNIIKIKNNNIIIPDFIVDKIKIIDAKRSYISITTKNKKIYPRYAETVIFWLLHGKTKTYENYSTVSSDDLIKQLSEIKNTEKLIQQIIDLKNGIHKDQERLR